MMGQCPERARAGRKPGCSLRRHRTGRPAEFLATRQKNIRPSPRRCERPQEKSLPAIQHLADLTGVPEEEAAKTLAAIEAQPRVTRELLMREFVETWLEGQRAAYRTQRRRG